MSNDTAAEVIQSPDQLTGQRFKESGSYSPDPGLDRAIRSEIVSSRHTVAALKPAQLKRILRLYNVSSREILEASTNQALVDLALQSGIVDVPDQWTLDRLKDEQDTERARISHARNTLSVTKSE